MTGLTIEQITEASRTRTKRWHTEDTEPWSLADWGNAMGGECGEAQNVIKKIRRIQTGTMGAHNGAETDRAKLRAKLGEELADTILYAVLVAIEEDIDLAQSIIDKFNLVSEESGFPERLMRLVA